MARAGTGAGTSPACCHAIGSGERIACAALRRGGASSRAGCDVPYGGGFRRTARTASARTASARTASKLSTSLSGEAYPFEAGASEDGSRAMRELRGLRGLGLGVEPVRSHSPPMRALVRAPIPLSSRRAPASMRRTSACVRRRISSRSSTPSKRSLRGLRTLTDWVGVAGRMSFRGPRALHRHLLRVKAMAGLRDDCGYEGHGRSWKVMEGDGR